MRNFILSLLLLFSGMCFGQYAIVLHGGAGNGLKPENVSSERQEAINQAVREALQAGASVLDTGGAAEDAVVAVLMVLENHPEFNAGKGAVLTWEGQPSLDASIMRGSDLQAGAISGVSRVKNPIGAALKVLTNSRHVLLSGSGADDFAKSQGLEMVSPDYFITKEKQRSLENFKKRYGATYPADQPFKFGTVGCAVLDENGNLAAGTSTGGMTGKQHGRIGDSPIIGAGTYANNETCAISSTGHGEYFIRYGVAFDIHARMKYLGQNGPNAAATVIHEVLKPAGGDGGVIGLTAEGEVIMEFNTSGMIRGFLKENGESAVMIFGE